MRSLSALLLAGILAPHDSLASEALAQRASEFYQLSECAQITGAYTGDSPAAAGASLREILRVNPKQSDEESIYALLETVSGSKFHLEMRCLPPLKSIAPYEKWVDLLRRKEIKSLGREDSAASRLISGLISELSAEKDPKLEALKMQMLDLLEPMYAEFQLRQSLERVFRILADPEGEARALVLASRMGDARAYRAAEAAVKGYLTGRFDDHEAFHRAVLAISEFAAKDPAVISGRQALLKEVAASKITPEVTRRAASQNITAQ